MVSSSNMREGSTLSVRGYQMGFGCLATQRAAATQSTDNKQPVRPPRWLAFFLPRRLLSALCVVAERSTSGPDEGGGAVGKRLEGHLFVGRPEYETAILISLCALPIDETD
ncbi:hypothetical protein OUZ56_028019 [Daphnia magna]|uniref:Uncharacterized protein n=1 Tax=Daphnia magna TaxID=35525 RepID=A0ABR0B2M3_9CRUS|nr:hypothetical protein OUZ56_028019 [Daphnia magna]